MDRKKKIRLVVIIPVIATLVVLGGVVYLALQAASGTPAPEGIEGIYERVEAEPGAVVGAEHADAGAVACDFGNFVGRPVDEAVLSGTARPYRVLPPGAMATMDHVPERINLHVNQDGVVTSVDCG